MNGPGVPRKLTFALRVSVSRNYSTSGSGARRGPTGLHRHPRILIPHASSFYCRTLHVVDPPFHMYE